MSHGKRRIAESDKLRFWSALASGMTIREAAHLGGIHYNTALNWVRKRDKLEADKNLADFNEKTKGSGKNGKTTVQIAQDIADSMSSPPVIPEHLLSERARRGLEDFDYFRRVYLGRVPSPWQVDAAYKIVQYLESEEKEFLVLNCPPGAGKSTLFHDVAVWCIVRNRKIRILIGSISEKLAKQYSRRIRETLERVTPLEPNPEDVRRGLAINAEASLTMDYGRFKPAALGALWRAEEFRVEQVDNRGMDNKEPTVSAYGIDSEFIGHRAELCLYDDVASPENAKESSSRDKLLERWDSMAEARLDPAGLLAVIGQRLGPGDLYAHCLSKVTYEEVDDDYDGSDVTQKSETKEPVKKYKYHQLIYKAYYEELDTGKESRRKDAPAWPNGPLLDPHRLSWKDLSYIRHNSPQKFETVYQQQDINHDAYLIQRVWATGGMGPDGVLYPGCIDNDRQPGFIPPGLTPPIISIASVDPSPTQFWAIQWWIYQPETNLRYLIDMERAKLTAEDLLGYSVAEGQYSGVMDEWQERSWELGYPISHWIVEINAAQRFLLAHDFVRRWQALHGVNVIPHTTSRNKLDQSLGIEALLPPLWRTGAVRLPTMRGSWKTLALLDEMCSWTREKKHGTDTVMAHWFAELHMPELVAPEQPPQLWRPSWLIEKYV